MSNFVNCRLVGDQILGGIAQLVEHVLCKHEVTGSNPVASTNFAPQNCRAVESEATEGGQVRVR